MIQLLTCDRCSSFLSFSINICPNCGTALTLRRRLALGIAGLAGGAAISTTLMACYGAPPCDYRLPDGSPDYDRCYGNPGDHTDGGLTDGGTLDGGR